MPIALHSFKIDDDQNVRICHTFYGETETEARQLQKDHARDCPHYGPALAKGETIDIVEEIDYLPVPEEDILLGFLDLDDEDEEPDEEEDEG